MSSARKTFTEAKKEVTCRIIRGSVVLNRISECKIRHFTCRFRCEIFVSGENSLIVRTRHKVPEAVLRCSGFSKMHRQSHPFSLPQIVSTLVVVMKQSKADA
jgi:hypothetical protein